jgi:hypothetical protein
LEVVECSTAEAAELIVVKIGTELLALVTDKTPGEMTGVQLEEISSPQGHPGFRPGRGLTSRTIDFPC